MTASPPIVLCPQCAEATEFSANNRFRPFCSERCRVIDLGGWASDRYRIAGNPLENDNLSESGDGSGGPSGPSGQGWPGDPLDRADRQG